MHNRNRLYLFIGLIGIIFLPMILLSLYVLSVPAEVHYLQTTNASIKFGMTVVYEVIAVSLLIFVLRKQNRNLSELGFTFEFSDIWHAIILFFVTYIVLIGVVILAPGFANESNSAKNVGFMHSQITLLYTFLILLNPFFEELLVRAFVITEILFFIGREEVAVLTSTLIQTSYHLYQGIPAALFLGILFLILSVYFAKFKRIMPVIYVHGVYDILAMLQHGWI